MARRAFEGIPTDYFDEPYDGDDDSPWNQFSSDFGFGFYDHDFVEADDADGRVIPVSELIRPCSYGTSFADAAARAAAQAGVPRSSFVFLMYNFKYDPRVTGTHESDCFRFIGVFPYDKGA